MLDVMLFLKGIVIGVSIAAPVGPVAILCIRRTLLHGRRAGVVTGLGAALADLIYGAMAAFGVAAVSAFLLEYDSWLRSVGGLFLIVVGAKTWDNIDKEQGEPARESGFAAFLHAFLPTIANPMTLIAFAAILPAFGAVRPDAGWLDHLLLIAGVGSGASLWWISLTLLVGLFRRRVQSGDTQWLHHLSGGILIVFGVGAIASVFIF